MVVTKQVLSTKAWKSPSLPAGSEWHKKNIPREILLVPPAPLPPPASKWHKKNLSTEITLVPSLFSCVTLLNDIYLFSHNKSI